MTFASRLGPSGGTPLPGRAALAVLLATLFACAAAAPQQLVYPSKRPIVLPSAQIEYLRLAAISWRLPAAAQSLRGMRLLYDARVPAKPALAVTRSILRSNPRLDPLDALIMATHAIGIARARGLDYGFFCATLLQESGFDPWALSSAGAIGIGQFTIETADAYGVDPFDWRDAMRGSAALLGRYLDEYDGRYDDPYAATLAAYNAGPEAVAHYHGVPPYRETQTYIADIYDRWSRIVRDVTGVGAWRQ